MSTAHDPERWRARFPILATTSYLVSHSLGAMPEAARERLAAYAEQWATRGVRAWEEGWWSAPFEVARSLERLLGAPPGSVSMQPGATLAQAVVASALDFGGGRDALVIGAHEFPSSGYLWHGLARRGARVVVVDCDAQGRLPLERLLAAIDERTRLVVLGHVCFRSSELRDLRAVCGRAREAGALVLLDAYQSLGCVPLDVGALGVDLACGGSVKWLCGGPGAGWLYVRPELAARLEPVVTGWAAHAAPFAFEPGPQRFAAGAARMLQGTPAVPCLLAAAAGYEVMLEVGVEAIRDWSLRLGEALREALLARGFETLGPASARERGGTLVVRLSEDESGPGYVRALAARGILVDHRPDAGLRVGPHFYTRLDEVLELAETLAELRERRAWREHAGEGA